MILEVIEVVIDFVTLRSVWKKKPAEVESAMKQAYSESKEAKQLDALAAAAKERADPAASANARERDVIRMGPLRSASPLVQKGSLSARPRVAHL